MAATAAGLPAGELTGMVAIVTGATQAMGEAIAFRLAADGAAVLGVGRNVERGAAMVERLRAAGLRADFVPADVGQEADVRRVVRAAVTQLGGIDIVVNNAASLDADAREAPAHEESSELFDQIMRVNLYGPFWFAKYATPSMMALGRGGVFVNISSYAAHRGVAAMPAYTASKAGLEALTRQIAVDYAEYGIRANSLVLGSIAVPRNQRLHDDQQMSEALRHARMVPRVGTPEDTADAVSFLASPRSGYITGAELNLDGGLLAKAPVVRVAQRLTEAVAQAGGN